MGRWKELLTLADFREAQRYGGYLVITDRTNPTKVHRFSCPFVEEGYFKTKVIIDNRINGKYFWLHSLADADNWNAMHCENCK